jgi:putative IMPACT (imprinted ancient) family translation regulator
MNKTLEIDFGDMKEIDTEFFLFEKIIKDRGSVYSVSTGRVENIEEIKQFVKKIRNYNKKFQKATHHSYAVRISKDGVFYETKSDDGETGAGKVILRILQKKQFTNIIVCVTRWFGGIKLEGDRFKHIQNSTIFILKNFEK